MTDRDREIVRMAGKIYRRDVRLGDRSTFDDTARRALAAAEAFFDLVEDDYFEKNA